MEEGYIEVQNQGLRIIGALHTRHLLSLLLGMGAFAPVALLALLCAEGLPHAPGFPYLVAGVLLALGALVGVVPVPSRKKTLLQVVWLQAKYRIKTQTYQWDRSYREQVHQALDAAWKASLEHTRSAEGAWDR